MLDTAAEEKDRYLYFVIGLVTLILGAREGGWKGATCCTVD